MIYRKKKKLFFSPFPLDNIKLRKVNTKDKIALPKGSTFLFFFFFMTFVYF